jgi:hypothetical protein
MQKQIKQHLQQNEQHPVISNPFSNSSSSSFQQHDLHPLFGLS